MGYSAPPAAGLSKRYKTHGMETSSLFIVVLLTAFAASSGLLSSPLPRSRSAPCLARLAAIHEPLPRAELPLTERAMARRELFVILIRSLSLSVVLGRPLSATAAEVDLEAAMQGFGDNYSGPAPANTTSTAADEQETLSQFLRRPAMRQPDPLTHGL